MNVHTGFCRNQTSDHLLIEQSLKPLRNQLTIHTVGPHGWSTSQADQLSGYFYILTLNTSSQAHVCCISPTCFSAFVRPDRTRTDRGCCCCGPLQFAIIIAQVEWVGKRFICLPHEMYFKDGSQRMALKQQLYKIRGV